MGRAFVILVLVVLAGCQAFPGGTERPTPAVHDFGNIEIVTDAYGYNESSYYRAGTITFTTSTTAANVTFHDVTLCLYDVDGNVLNSTVLGDFSGTDDSASFVLSADERPEYLTVDHPRFHEFDLMRPLTIEWNDDENYEHHDSSLGSIQDDFEYPRHNEMGRCL